MAGRRPLACRACANGSSAERPIPPRPAAECQDGDRALSHQAASPSSAGGAGPNKPSDSLRWRPKPFRAQPGREPFPVAPQQTRFMSGTVPTALFARLFGAVATLAACTQVRNAYA